MFVPSKALHLEDGKLRSQVTMLGWDLSVLVCRYKFFFLLREKTKDSDSWACQYSLDFLKCNSGCPQKPETWLLRAQDALGTREATGSGCKLSLCWDDSSWHQLCSCLPMPMSTLQTCPPYFIKAGENALR